MAGVEQPRMKLLYLIEFLRRESDEERGVTMASILSYLEQHGVRAERKSVYRDIQTLIDYGFEIEKNHSRPVEYCLIRRDFDLAELKLLVDAVQSAHFIPEDMTDRLIRKLEAQTSRRRAGELRRQVHNAGRVKTQNDHVYYTTGTLHDAINRNRRVTFQYIEYTLQKGVSLRRSGECYEISPYALVWNDDKYYVVGFYERYNKVCNFRVDRMKSVTPSRLACVPKPPDYDIETYIKSVFGMYTGELLKLDLCCENSVINSVIDRFGTEIPIHPDGPDHFVAHVTASVSPVFYSWLFQFGGKIQILRPSRIADAYRAMVDEVRAGQG